MFGNEIGADITLHRQQKKRIQLTTKKLTIMATKNYFNESTRNGFKSATAVINSIHTRLGMMARVAILMAAMAIVSTAPAMGQVKFGFKGGITTTELKNKNSLLDKSKHTAYTGGVMLDLNIPKVNLGLEVSALYRYSQSQKLDKSSTTVKRHAIDIPIYARYRLSIPVVERIVAPIVFTGPNISVIVKDDNKLKDPNNSKTRVSWDIGAGVDLFKHVRLTASYGIGLKKTMDVIGQDYDGKPVEGKDKCWTVSAAIMF